MPRLNRNTPLPEAAHTRVSDPLAQRAIDAIATSLIAVIKYLQPFVQQERWRPAEFTTGWQDYNTATVQSRKDPLGIVHLRGVCFRTSGVYTTMLVLPREHRPRRNISIVSISDNLVCRIDIEPSGEVMIGSGGAPAVWVSLEGITFDTEP